MKLQEVKNTCLCVWEAINEMVMDNNITSYGRVYNMDYIVEYPVERIEKLLEEETITLRDVFMTYPSEYDFITQADEELTPPDPQWVKQFNVKTIAVSNGADTLISHAFMIGMEGTMEEFVLAHSNRLYAVLNSLLNDIFDNEPDNKGNKPIV